MSNFDTKVGPDNGGQGIGADRTSSTSCRRVLTTTYLERFLFFRPTYNPRGRALSFTSLGVHEDQSVNKGDGPPVFRISGELHHLSGLLHPLRAVRLSAKNFAGLCPYKDESSLHSDS